MALRSFNIPIHKHGGLSALLMLSGLLLFTACTPAPPSTRSPTPLADPSGDPAAGEEAFETYCGQCHEFIPGLNRRAPNLKGIYGSKAGVLSDYEYSDQIKMSSLVWDEENLTRYMMAPKEVFSDTKMLVDQFPDDEQAQDIVAFVAAHP